MLKNVIGATKNAYNGFLNSNNSCVTAHFFTSTLHNAQCTVCAFHLVSEVWTETSDQCHKPNKDSEDAVQELVGSCSVQLLQHYCWCSVNFISSIFFSSWFGSGAHLMQKYGRLTCICIETFSCFPKVWVYARGPSCEYFIFALRFHVLIIMHCLFCNRHCRITLNFPCTLQEMQLCIFIRGFPN